MRRVRVLSLSTIVIALACAPTASADRVFTVKGASAPGPAKYDRVRVIEQGPRHARNVLVLVPGTSGGAAYFHPVAADIVKRLHGWRVWSVDRRENLLEDHSVLDKALTGRATPQELFRYYLEWLGDPSVSPHFTPVADSGVPFARRWGMGVAIRDLHRVIKAARRGGNRVVLGGHSLGGTITVAYATWDFGGRAGACDLDGLVLIDGGSSRAQTITKADAQKQLADLQTRSPFLDLTGLGLPWSAGVFNIVGSTAARLQPNATSVLAGWPLLPANLRPPVTTTNAGGYGYALDNDTSPDSLRLVHMHIGHLAERRRSAPVGRRRAEHGPAAPRGCSRASRASTARSGTTRSASASTAGPSPAASTNPAQKVLGVRATHGADVHLPIYAIETSLGAGRVLRGARALARRSHVRKRLVLVDRHKTYDHIDPLSALPGKNAFLKTVIPFLRRVR